MVSLVSAQEARTLWVRAVIECCFLVVPGFLNYLCVAFGMDIKAAARALIDQDLDD